MNLTGNVCGFTDTQDDRTRALSSVGERLLRRHLQSEIFRTGVEQGLWRLITLRWPSVVFAIGELFSTRDPEIVVSLGLELYPISAPTLQLWNLPTNANIAVHAWPKWSIDFLTRYPNL